MASVVGASLVAVLVAAAAAAAQGPSWSDPAGDAFLAPDILLVSGNWNADNTVSFAVIMGQERLYGGESVTIYLDVDLSGATGDRGADYAITLNRMTWTGYTQALTRWTGSGWVDAPSSTLTWVAPANGVAGGISRADIGWPAAGVDFWVHTVHTEPSLNRYYDFAPNGGYYSLRPPSSVGGAHGPGVSAPSPPPSAASPRLLTRRVRARSGRVAVRLSCPPTAAPCGGRLDLRSRAGALLGRAPYAVAPGTSTLVRVRLTRRGRALAARRGPLRVTLQIGWANGIARRAVTVVGPR